MHSNKLHPPPVVITVWLKWLFMPPRSWGILFLSCLSFFHCHSVILWNSETLTLLITFVQWVLKLCHFTWIFLVIKPFCGYHYFYSVTLTLEFDPFFENFNPAFKQWALELWYFTWKFPVIWLFLGYHYFFTPWPWSWILIQFLKTLT